MTGNIFVMSMITLSVLCAQCYSSGERLIQHIAPRRRVAECIILILTLYYICDAAARYVSDIETALGSEWHQGALHAIGVASIVSLIVCGLSSFAWGAVHEHERRQDRQP